MPRHLSGLEHLDDAHGRAAARAWSLGRIIGERLVDEAAREIGMDPVEFRRRNMIPKAKMPYKLCGGFEYDCGDFEGAMDKALRAADWAGFERRRADSATRRSRTGKACCARHRKVRSGKPNWSVTTGQMIS